MKLGKYIVGLISGLTFGLLFAPRKGEELRAELSKKSSKSGAEGLRVLGNAFKGAGKDALSELKNLSEHEQVAAFLELSHEKMKSFLEAAEERGYDVAEAVQEKLQSFAEMAKDKAIEIKDKIVGGKPRFSAMKNETFSSRKIGLKKTRKKRAKKSVKK